MRAVIKGTVEGSEGSWFGAVAATPFNDGANLEPVSPSQVRPLSSSSWTDAPQFMRMRPVELLSAAMASAKRANSVRHVRVAGRAGKAILEFAAVGAPESKNWGLHRINLLQDVCILQEHCDFLDGIWSEKM